MLEFIKVEDGYIKFTEDEFKDLLNKYKNYLLDKINFDDLDEVYTNGYNAGYEDCFNEHWSNNKEVLKVSNWNDIVDSIKNDSNRKWLEDLLFEVWSESK